MLYDRTLVDRRDRAAARQCRRLRGGRREQPRGAAAACSSCSPSGASRDARRAVTLSCRSPENCNAFQFATCDTRHLEAQMYASPSSLQSPRRAGRRVQEHRGRWTHAIVSSILAELGPCDCDAQPSRPPVHLAPARQRTPRSRWHRCTTSSARALTTLSSTRTTWIRRADSRRAVPSRSPRAQRDRQDLPVMNHEKHARRALTLRARRGVHLARIRYQDSRCTTSTLPTPTSRPPRTVDFLAAGSGGDPRRGQHPFIGTAGLALMPTRRRIVHEFFTPSPRRAGNLPARSSSRHRPHPRLGLSVEFGTRVVRRPVRSTPVYAPDTFLWNEPETTTAQTGVHDPRPTAASTSPCITTQHAGLVALVESANN